MIGGVSDYSRSIAVELVKLGEVVHVWCPRPSGSPDAFSGMQIHELPLGYSVKGIQYLDEELSKIAGPRRLFVQWVPHGYGQMAMNVPFCNWLLRRTRKGDEIDLMLHEPFLMFGEGSWKQKVVAVVHRLMISMALRSATRLWFAIPSWKERVGPWQFGRKIPFQWLPVPSAVEPVSKERISLGQHFASERPLIGHFGTYGRHVQDLLQQILPGITRDGSANILLLGRDSDRAANEMSTADERLRGRIWGKGTSPMEELTPYFNSCEFMLQPYPDGISSRRSSAMAALAHGKGIVSTFGLPTEPLWSESGAVVLNKPDAHDKTIDAVRQLLASPDDVARMAERSAKLYASRFAAHLSAEQLVRSMTNR